MPQQSLWLGIFLSSVMYSPLQHPNTPLCFNTDFIDWRRVGGEFRMDVSHHDVSLFSFQLFLHPQNVEMHFIFHTFISKVYKLLKETV